MVEHAVDLRAEPLALLSSAIRRVALKGEPRKSGSIVQGAGTRATEGEGWEPSEWKQQVEACADRPQQRPAVQASDAITSRRLSV